MAVISSPRTARPEPTAASLALAVADANWYTTENLFGALQREGVATLLLKCVDYYNAWQRGAPPWAWGRALRQRGPALWQRDLVLPSGWMKRFPNWGMRPIRRSIADWRDRHAPGARLALVMTYPHYLYLRDQVRPDIHVYFNIDDYSQYWPRCARQVNLLERRAVRESDLTVCVSRLRSEQLKAAVPEAADRIRHLPHGAPATVLGESPQERPAPPPADLAGLPRPLLGYVGSLEDRIDWVLLTRLAEALPHASIVLIGRLAGPRKGPWIATAQRCLSLPNVHALGWRPQEAIGRYNAAFDVCLIPYRADHPFNRVCCPTKIMDYMGTGRPIVSTALPECQLYGHLFDVVADTGAFLDAVRAILAAGSDDGRAAQRFEWARANSCQRVVERFLDWLPA
ncbi:MAG TPA: glycosyltransferase [Isosphaeraceae bacterium]